MLFHLTHYPASQPHDYLPLFIPQLNRGRSDDGAWAFQKTLKIHHLNDGDILIQIIDQSNAMGSPFLRNLKLK